MTMNTTWGFKTYDAKWQSSAAIIRNLIDIASKGDYSTATAAN
jgi:alpha-L-fucosidase